MNAFVGADTAADRAERLVAEVRDDPAARIRFAFDTYTALFGSSRHRSYATAVIAFMRWQNRRGVLNSPHGGDPGSPWWRAVNEQLLRDTCEAGILVQRGGGEASRPSVKRWVDFFEAPSAALWYLAHNGSTVAGYLANQDLAAAEVPAERFFMNVVLLRVLYAHALVSEGDLALGRLSFLSRLIGHPMASTPRAFLAIPNVVPAEYPIKAPTVEALIDLENPLGRVLDYAVIGTRVDALYAFAADALEEPRLLGLVRNGAPVYAWPYEHRHVWRSGRATHLKAIVGALTRPIGRSGPGNEGDDVA
jgi:hypothetical protein